MVSLPITALTADLHTYARELGFVAVGIAHADPLPDDRRAMQERIADGWFEGMTWLNADRAIRATTPDLVLAGARSIVSLAAPYRATLDVDAADLGPTPRGRVARYAWGRDYHRVLEKKLKQLCNWLDERLPGMRSRPLVDYGPLAERAYAAHAGLGWTGKSTNLLIPGTGSWTLLADILTTAELAPDTPLRKSCGGCTRCVAGCPTGAIVAPYAVDARRCISFQTIEQRGPVPRELRPLHGDWLFGCDVCQDSCPVPSRMQPMREFGEPSVGSAAPELLPLLALSEEEFRARFAGRAVMRAKRDGLLRNACIVLGNTANDEAVPALVASLRTDPAPLVRGHAAWALGRIGGRATRAPLAAARTTEQEPSVHEEIEAALDDRGREGSVKAYDASALAAWLRGERQTSPGSGLPERHTAREQLVVL